MVLAARSSKLHSAASSTPQRNLRAWNVLRSSSECLPRGPKAALTYHRGMQDCFRLHPEMYGSELEDDEDEIEEELRARENGSSDKSEDEISAPAIEPTAPVVQKTTQPGEQNISRTTSSDEQSKQRSIAQADDSKQVSRHTQASSEKDDELIPKAAHDATKK